MRHHHYGWEVAILAITVAWGATFVSVQHAVALVAVMPFLAVRFAVAGVLLALVRPRELVRAGRIEILGGIAAGIPLFASYAFQTTALQHASSSNVGFITGLYVILVPLFAAVLLRRLPSRASIAAVALATVGLFLLANPSSGGFGTGELLALLCAATFAVQILLLGWLAPRVSPIPFTAIEMLVVAAAAALGMLGSGRAGDFAARPVWEAIVFTAVLASAVAYLVQIAAQRYVPPTRAAILFAMESPFAAVFGFFLAGDRIGVAGWVGGLLMVGGVLVTETKAPAEEPT